MITGATYTRANEGCRLAAYDDKTGLPLKAGEAPRGTCTIGFGCTGPDIQPGLIWTQSEAENAFTNRYTEAVHDAGQRISAAAWSVLDEPRRAVLVDMAYQMGAAGLAKFALLLRAIERKDWQAAHDECLASNYAAQTPNRATRNALCLLDGQLRPPP